MSGVTSVCQFSAQMVKDYDCGCAVQWVSTYIRDPSSPEIPEIAKLS